MNSAYRAGRSPSRIPPSSSLLVALGGSRVVPSYGSHVAIRLRKRLPDSTRRISDSGWPAAFGQLHLVTVPAKCPRLPNLPVEASRFSLASLPRAASC